MSASEVFLTAKSAQFLEFGPRPGAQAVAQPAPRFTRLEIDDQPLPAASPVQAGPGEVFLLQTHVAGTSYVELTGIEPEIGTLFQLEREPDNPFDPLAILVLDAEGRKLGYVPKAKNEILARLMDVGKQMQARLVAKNWFKDWLRMDIQVFLYEE